MNERDKPEPRTKEIVDYDSKGNRHIVTLYKVTDIDGQIAYANRNGRIIPKAVYSHPRHFVK